MSTPSPAPDTAALLRKVVGHWRALVTTLRSQGSLSALTLVGTLSHAVYRAEHDSPHPPPWDEHEVLPLLEELLRTDEHLRATCLQPYSLAMALELLGLDSLIEASELDRGDAFDDMIVEHLVRELFRGEYRSRAYCRLYNVVVLDESPFDLAPVSCRIELLQPADIPGITGETTALSMLHREGTGDGFLVFEVTGYGQEAQGFTARWQREAFTILQAMKYIKYAIVDIDYTALRFDPPWVNKLRRYGVSLGGHPRFEVQPRQYVLDAEARKTLLRYLTVFRKYQAVLEDMKPTLRRALATAGAYYERHHGRNTPSDQLIDTVIALESLFSPPGEKQELSYRMCLTAATFLGRDADDIHDIQRFLLRMYNARSKLVHQGENPFTAAKAKDKVGAEELDRLGDLVRQAILRTGVLLARGDYERDRKKFYSSLSRAVFDHTRREAIRARSDLEHFLMEEGL